MADDEHIIVASIEKAYQKYSAELGTLTKRQQAVFKRLHEQKDHLKIEALLNSISQTTTV